jgi:hypothetical protein
MTFDPYGYSDPYTAQALQSSPGFPVVQQQPVAGSPLWAMPMQPVPGGPLAGLDSEIAGVLNAADSHHVYVPGPGGGVLSYPRGRQPSIARDMAYGAAAGLAGWLVWRQMQRRRHLKGEWTSPGFRALGLLLGFPVIGIVLGMIWLPEGSRFLGAGVVLGLVSFAAYAAFRAAGGGRFNIRRRGSPWRADHRPR